MNALEQTLARTDVYFGAKHVALAEALKSAGASFTLADHDAKKAATSLATHGLFRWLVPSNASGMAAEHGDASRLDLRALCLIRETLGAVCPMADSIFAVQGLGSHPVVLSPETHWKQAFLAEVAAGKRIGAFALTEPGAGTDIASMQTVAARSGDKWRLTGEKIFISNAGLADHYVVFANADPASGKKGISAFLVDARSEGLEIELVPLAIDHPIGRVTLRNCEATELLWEVGKGMRLALGTLDMFRTSVGAAACGMAKRAITESIAHVKKRMQFGKPLADFQLTQAAIAEMATELDAARLLVYRAATEKDVGTPDATSVAMAKMFATEAAQRIIDRAVQLHGGLGVTRGSAVEQLYREIRPLRIYEGTTEIQKLIIGEALLRGA